MFTTVRRKGRRQRADLFDVFYSLSQKRTSDFDKNTVSKRFEVQLECGEGLVRK